MAEEKNTVTQKSAVFPVVPVVVVVAVLAVVGGVIGYQKYKARSWFGQGYQAGMMRGARDEGRNNPGGRKMGGAGGMMEPQPTPPLTELQKQEIASGTATTTTNKTFTINGGNFYFVPNSIMVNKGDTVTIVFKNDGGMHDFIIDELDVKSQTIQTGTSETVTFVADKVGSFQYYCSVGSHRKLGMFGTLTVK
ncbi:MAG: cupredoxin domain-containing protein [Patescibacteria group bacterium]|jgi:plastocyanin